MKLVYTEKTENNRSSVRPGQTLLHTIVLSMLHIS